MSTPPATIPALQAWESQQGEWTLTPRTRVVSATDRFASFRVELNAILHPVQDPDHVPAAGHSVSMVEAGAEDGDIEIIIDEARVDDLGVEGYQLSIARGGVTITAADSRGAFHGTRTLSQMLRQQLTLPAGTARDVPKYKERGVTLCAGVINISTDFIDRLLTDMADLKLNHLLLELKLETDDPRHNFWSFYTQQDVARLVAKATELGIDVVPEINSPGHMGVWLRHRPEMRLVNNEGEARPNQLDISHPDAFGLYTSLIDQYTGVFTSDYWHMGADEYMIDTSFMNYDALTQWARATYGDGATIGDAFIAFINRVNEYVKTTHGKKLRIWNDGIVDTEVVKLDRDIVVEFWEEQGIAPEVLIERGYELTNANGLLYFSRSAMFFKVNSEKLWNESWNVGNFVGKAGALDPEHPNIRGAKVSIWPDESHFQTENEVEAEVFDSLRLISQLTWTGSHRDAMGQEMSWATFKAGIDSVGRNPLWLNLKRLPLEAGEYVFALHGDDTTRLAVQGTGVVLSAAPTTWLLTPTEDHYYQLTSRDTGQCLAVTEGLRTQTLVLEIGARPSMVESMPMDDDSHDTAGDRNPQKWQILATGDGIILVNALTNQVLSTIKGFERSVDFSAAPTTSPLGEQSLRPAVGTLVQLPPHMTDDVWVATRIA